MADTSVTPETSIEVDLTDELAAFLDASTGSGTSYTDAGDFIRTLLRREMERSDAANAREAIVEGLTDIAEGRVYEWRGSVRELIDRHRATKAAQDECP